MGREQQMHNYTKDQDKSDVMIKFDRVTKKYRGLTVVDHISFEVYRGEICGFLGPNGAGKTTSLRMLLGLLRPTSGRIEVQGTDVHRNAPAALDGVGAIVEESRFYPYLSGEQNLRQALRLRNLDITETAIEERLEAVGLKEARSRRVKGYSLGMRQRLALALALLQDPVILVLDEPMNGLDPTAMREFRLHLLQLSQSGVTVLLSSHILSEVEQLATRLVFINHGHIVGIEDLRTDQAAQAYIRCAEPKRLGAWFDTRNIEAEATEDGGYRLHLERAEDMASLIRRLVHDGMDILEARPYKENLERQYMDRMAITEKETQNVEA